MNFSTWTMGSVRFIRGDEALSVQNIGDKTVFLDGNMNLVFSASEAAIVLGPWESYSFRFDKPNTYSANTTSATGIFTMANAKPPEPKVEESPVCVESDGGRMILFEENNLEESDDEVEDPQR